MKTKELRIGNTIETYLEPQISEWIETEVTFKTLRKIQDNPNSHGYRPIPLTEEWLLKFGFEECLRRKQGILKQYRKSNIKFDISNSGNVYYSHKNIPMYSVHQLQNLYFALTGEELKTKEL